MNSAFNGVLVVLGVLLCSACGASEPEAVQQLMHQHQAPPKAQRASTTEGAAAPAEARTIDEAPTPVCEFKDRRLEQATLEQLGLEAEAVPLELAGQVHELRVNGAGVMFLQGIECFPELRTLEVEHNAITDAAPLASLPGLRQLVITDNTVTDLSVISRLTGLTKFHAHGNGIRDPVPLANLRQLTELRLGNNPLRPRGVKLPASAFDFLLELPRLTKLDIARIDLFDAGKLPDLRNLRELSLREGILKDATPVLRFTELRVLNLELNFLEDISMLAQLPRLAELKLRDNFVSDPATLEPFQAVAGERLSIDLTLNPLPCDRELSLRVEQLAARGVDVLTDCQR